MALIGLQGWVGVGEGSAVSQALPGAVHAAPRMHNLLIRAEALSRVCAWEGSCSPDT